MTNMKDLVEAKIPDNFCIEEIPVEFTRPRTILSSDTTDEFLVFQRGSSEVLRVFDTDNDGIPDKSEAIGAKGGNHGMAYRDGFIYISSDSTVWRWKYEWGESAVTGDRETVVINIDKDGKGGAPLGHTTRTLIFDDQGRLYISVGSNENVDEDSHRSRIRRLTISDQNANLPLDYQNAEVFADGLRNEVGLAFDRHGVLWGVENGADNLMRSDLGGDIHNDNPGEELNRFPESLAGSHWGYPECWSEYDLPQSIGLGRGTQWAWPSLSSQQPIAIMDKECREERIASELSMQAHSAPLGITFYNYSYSSSRPEGCTGEFPESMHDHAFIAFHGSWNRDTPTGYSVGFVPMTEDGFVDADAAEPSDFLSSPSDNGAKWSSGFRPVDVEFDRCGRLLVTSDGTGREGRGSNVVRISYGSNACRSNDSSAGSTISASHSDHHLVSFFVFALILLMFQ